jgi:alkanesulfonate monooxygenase SsuD/methylene tetrahydromethanopterin reductase-like flavin-dependent oxidoreductase (luciferase family)
MAPSPGVYLAAVAARTTRLRFGPLVYLLPFYNPLRLVEEICMLDNLSRGRFQLGVGRGVSPYEGGFFGIDTAESPFRFVEALDVVLEGLTTDRLVHRGEFYKINDVPMELKPFQQPHPPLWYGLGSERSTGIPARYGMNVVMLGPTDHLRKVAARYREAWDEQAGTPGRTNGPVRAPLIGASRHLVIAETDAEAERLARPAYDRWYRSLTQLSTGFGYRQLTSIGDFDEARRVGVVLAGSAASVRAELERQVEVMGVNYLVFQLAFGDLGLGPARRTLDAVASEIMPALARASV